MNDTVEDKVRPMRQENQHPTLCIGLDIAWFGGSAGDKDSQYDCLAAAVLNSGGEVTEFEFERVKLINRDQDANQLLTAIDGLLQRRRTEQIVFALDAPIQARVREHLGLRAALPKAGTVVQRAADSWLSQARQAIDRQAGGSQGWHPNIQPGAPLAPRIERLLEGLASRGFHLWLPDQRTAQRLVIECFPAEALWAMKRMAFYDEAISATRAKAYKAQKRKRLTAEQVRSLVNDALLALGPASIGSIPWQQLVGLVLDWQLTDSTWQTTAGLYRGGKLLDDGVDTMICLATSLSYALQRAHVWFDPQAPDDGHMIGPGFQNDGRWTAAWQ